jgi:hypothetical protein
VNVEISKSIILVEGAGERRELNKRYSHMSRAPSTE